MIYYAKKINNPNEANFSFNPIFDKEHLDFISLDYQEVIDYVMNCEVTCITGGYDVERSKKTTM